MKKAPMPNGDILLIATRILIDMDEADKTGIEEEIRTEVQFLMSEVSRVERSIGEFDDKQPKTVIFHQPTHEWFTIDCDPGVFMKERADYLASACVEFLRVN